jgi:hypothetical protein
VGATRTVASRANKHVFSYDKLNYRDQRGIGLLMTFIVLILAAGYVLTSYLSPSRIKLAQDKRSTDILSDAREFLIANAVSVSALGERPGYMPTPDVISDTPATRNYNGDSELGCFDSSKPNGLPLIVDHENARCLGRLPWRTVGFSMDIPTEQDAIGQTPWYAVSANLVFQKCLEYLNSEILDFSYVGYICPVDGIGSPTSLPYPWLTVRDTHGQVLSDRVALVLLVPGPSINGQLRPPPPNLAGTNQYLDSVTITVTNVTPECPGPPCNLIFSNADIDNDFIQADQSLTFNDRLIYVTIDELMTKIEARAGREILASVQRFRDIYGTYPWLAPYSNPGVAGNYHATIGARVGLIPHHKSGQQFITEFSWRITNGTVDRTGTVSLNAIRNTLNLTVTNGECEWINIKAVNCVGEISNPEPIANPAIAKRVIQIEYPTSWTNTVVTPTPATAATFNTRRIMRPNGSLSACLTTSLVRCVIVRDYDGMGNLIGEGALRTGTGTLQTSLIRLYPDLPEWFTDNRWHELALGAIGAGSAPGAGSACPCLITNLDGSLERSDIKFLILMGGRSLTGQTRPSANPSDYFDSANNRNVTNGQSFDRQSTLTNSFNDSVHY